MKFLSSSASSTITTTTSIDGNIYNPKSATAGCLTGVLRRLFCFNSLPTYPSDQIKDAEVNSAEYDKQLQYLETEEKVELEAAATPGIVARLMGLESMPMIHLANTHLTPNSISRSRSMNSVDSLREFGSKHAPPPHRRVKTSLSFREAPTFLELEDEKFFVLSFQNGVETEELGSKVKKSSTGFGELKARKAERCKNKNNRGENVFDKEKQETNKLINHKVDNNGKAIKDSSNVLRPRKNSNDNSHVSMEAVRKWKPTNHEGKSEGGRSRRKKKKKMKENESVAKKVETECDSKNSSPVSVLDFGDMIDHPQVHTSEEDSRLTGSNLRRKLSAELENSSPCNTQSSTSDDREMKKSEGKCHGSRKKDYQSQNYVEKWSEICKMTGQDMLELNWIYRDMWKLEDIGADFGLQIFEQLLNELVDQLVGNSHEIFDCNTT